MSRSPKPDRGKVVAIIPARGGSKGVPHKNLRPLAGKPLIVHTIDAALSAREVHLVCVTTDSPQIAEIAVARGALAIERPADLASDTASSEAALEHAVAWLQRRGTAIDLVAFLQCTSPLRSAGDIDNAIARLRSEQADSLLSATPSHRFLWTLESGQARSVNYDYRHRPRRQDMASQYLENGSIYLFKPWVLEQYGNRLGGRIALYVMGEDQGVEIDTEADFKVLEALMTTDQVPTRSRGD